EAAAARTAEAAAARTAEAAGPAEAAAGGPAAGRDEAAHAGRGEAGAAGPAGRGGPALDGVNGLPQELRIDVLDVEHLDGARRVAGRLVQLLGQLLDLVLHQ